MEVINDGYIVIEDSRIQEVSRGEFPKADKVIERKDCVVIPGFINAHTHIGDSVFKESGLGKNLNELFKPPNGLKHKLLKNTSGTTIRNGIENTLSEMLQSGIVVFADFREEALAGVKILHGTLDNKLIKGCIFGRLDFSFSNESLEKNNIGYPEDILLSSNAMKDFINGIVPTSPNDVTDEALRQLSSINEKNNWLRITHVAEDPNSIEISKRRTGLTEVERAINYFKADSLVHGIYLNEQDLDMIADENIPITCCPKANALLGLDLPLIPDMIKKEILVSLGTDNVMLNPPDMFKEMSFALTIYRSKGSLNPSPENIFQMTTINGAKTLRIEKEFGSIKEGKRANLVFIKTNTNRLRFSKNILASIILRSESSDVELVLIDGKIAFKRTDF
jgi:cytosine/adenosine deaminase-related metal-dependent hydrolase